MSHTDPPLPGASVRQAPPSHDGSDNPDVAHDTSDVNVRAIIGFGVGLFAVTAVVFVLMYGLFGYLSGEAAKDDPVVSPLAARAADVPRSTVGNPFFGQGPGPHLLTHEPTVLATHRKMEQDALGSYGWVDQKAGVARLPIAEAKKLILQRGLPVRADGVDPSLGTRRPVSGESSSGRTITAGKKPEEAAKEPAPPPPAPHKPHEQ